MTTTTAIGRAKSAVAPDRRTGGLGWWASDVWQIAVRNIKHIVRSPELIMYALFQPVMFILLFNFVFGGAIDVPGGNYAQFLMPGIFVQMVLFGSVAGMTSGVAQDMQRGLMDRFRSMPMYRSPVLAGRTVSELARSLVAIVVMVVVGLLIGFRFETGLLPAVAGFALLLLFGYGLTWLAAFIGMSVKSPEAAQSAGTIWLFPFSFISSAFVPSTSMPGWLRVYADHSPMTVAVDSLRSLFTGTDAGTSILQLLCWSIGLIVVFGPLATWKFARAQR